MLFRSWGRRVGDEEAASSADQHFEGPELEDIAVALLDHALPEWPSFKTWVHIVWLDIFSLIFVALAAVPIFLAPPAPHRRFPVFEPSGSIVYPEFAYQSGERVIPTWMSAVLSGSIPILTILFMQIRIRSFWDANAAIFGVLYALVTSGFFQVALKILIGGLRPNFLSTCKPLVVSPGAQQGNGFAGLMYDRSICTGDPFAIDDALESFPSGHATAAGASLVFLFLYLNAKLKVWSNHQPAYWMLVLLYLPLLGMALICGSLTIDHTHNSYDIAFGAGLGALMAASAYRLSYASIWDFRINHIPLRRDVPFTYGYEQRTYDGLVDVVWTRAAG